MALKMPISLACSMRLADMEELKEKKQRNIVIKIITSNINVMALSTEDRESSAEVPDIILLRYGRAA